MEAGGLIKLASIENPAKKIGADNFRPVGRHSGTCGWRQLFACQRVCAVRLRDEAGNNLHFPRAAKTDGVHGCSRHTPCAEAEADFGHDLRWTLLSRRGY